MNLLKIKNFMLRVHTLLTEGNATKQNMTTYPKRKRGIRTIRQQARQKKSLFLNAWLEFNLNGQQREPPKHRRELGSDRHKVEKKNKTVNAHQHKYKWFTVRPVRCLLLQTYCWHCGFFLSVNIWIHANNTVWWDICIKTVLLSNWKLIHTLFRVLFKLYSQLIALKVI